MGTKDMGKWDFTVDTIDAEKVKHCIELATLAPNSINMQLWEFYHITDTDILKKPRIVCLNQESESTTKWCFL